MSTATAANDTTRPIVAITGLNGYIAVHVAIHFLEKGFDVRGSVRSASSVEKINDNPIWKKWIDEKRVQVVIVPDLQGDLTELLQGVEVIAHLAAPVGQNLKSWDEYKLPTINGVLNVLNQAQKFGTIKAISIMSSMAAAFNPVPKEQQIGKNYTEEDWFPYDEAACEALDSSNPYASLLWYCAAKKYAEFAIQDWIKEKKPSFSIAILRPPMTYGPVLNFTSPQEFNGVNGSLPGWLSLIKGKDAHVPESEATAYADPRDVAAVFYQAAIRRKTDTYNISTGEYSYQMFVNEFRKLRPDLDSYFPLGNPDEKTPKELNYFTIDGSKAAKELDINYHTLEETSKDTLDHYEAIGVFKVAPGSWVKEV
ncbi:uncharacterized protein IL334_003064 [Kwoniella shivajii]|uniref:NAD-dependent epimerase/dehydratase domain-containing protein n=1 Tax=Kwoniella shivajii TaxID=564305 RepID=A0ABZ1CZH8_9TREE|nr:hypothetical protein IL334_003064 [Kwoniella shivajii]